MADVVYNLFGSQAPATVDGGDTGAITVGLSFYVSEAISLTAIRFYKAPANTGTHQWGLWSNLPAANLLDSGTITGETASGWQTYNLPTPVALTANVRYFAGVLMPVGRYSVTPSDFTTEKVSGPLHAPAAGTGLFGYGWQNGLYTYGAALARPASSYQAGNYFVDVQVGTPSAAGPLTKAWDGAQWVQTSVRVWDGAQWVPVKVWNGSDWVEA